MERTKELQLLQTVVGVITLNVGGKEQAFTVFYGGAMYPWVDGKMLVMPEAKYKDMLKEFFLNDGKEYVVPTPQKIAQDRAEVINNYRAGMYANPDDYGSYQPIEEPQVEIKQVEESTQEYVEEPKIEEDNTEMGESTELEMIDEEKTEEPSGDVESEIQEEPQEESEIQEVDASIIVNDAPMIEEQHAEETYFDLEDEPVEQKENAIQEEPKKSEITAETIDIIRSRHLIDERMMLKDGLAFVSEIDDIGGLFMEEPADAIDELIISATDTELAKMAEFLVHKYNLEDKISDNYTEELVEGDEQIEPEHVISEEYTEPEPIIEEPVETESKMVEEDLELEPETVDDENGTLPEDVPLEEIDKEYSDIEPKKEEPTREIIREIVKVPDDSKIEELFNEIRKLQEEIRTVKKDDAKPELSAINNKLNQLIDDSKPNGELENALEDKLDGLSTGLKKLIELNIDLNRDIDVSQISTLVDEQNQMMAKQNEAIQELTQTVESQKEIIDKFKEKIDKTQKAEKTRVKKTWAIMILGVIIMVGITVCTQLFLPKAESAIKLDSNTDAEVHIVIHNDDGTDSFERIGSIIIKNGKLELAD